MLRHSSDNNLPVLVDHNPLCFNTRQCNISKSEGIQIIHSHGCHWVVAHKEASFSDVVKVYDLLYDVDDVVKKIITNLFLFSDCPIIEVVPIQKQAVSSNNCGLFMIAVCVAIFLKENPSVVVFKEDKMRSHLYSCFELSIMTTFPCSQ